MFGSQLRAVKNIAHDEHLYEEQVIGLLQQGVRGNDILYHLYINVCGIISGYAYRESDNTIDALKILDVISDTFLNLTDKQLMVQYKYERKLKLRDINETETIFEDFNEA